MLTAGLFGVQAVERAADSFHAALHIRLDDEIERLDLAGGYAGMHIFQRRSRLTLQVRPSQTLLDKLPRSALVLDGFENVARFGHATDSEYFDRLGRRCLLNLFTAVRQHRTDPSPQRPHDDIVAYAEYACLDENGCDGASAAVYASLDNYASCLLPDICLEFAYFRDDTQVVQQVVNAVPR